MPYNSTGYALTITATGYTQYSNPAVPITQAIVAIPVNMVKSTPASGRIDFTDLLDANNMRLTAGTLIDLFVSTQELPLSSTAYPASGDLIYTGLAAGTYVIKTKINGTYKNFQTNPVVLVLASGSMTVTASGVLLSDPGSARVTVTMKDGSTVVDGTVSAKQAGVTKAASLTSGGITTFSNNLNPGTYDFYFLPTEVYFGTPHAESLTKAITAGRTTLVNITAYIRNAFSITTVDSAGNPVNGVQIYIDGSLAGTTSAGKINANIWYAKDTGTDYSVRWVYNGHDVAVTRGLNFDTTSWGLVVN